MARTVNDLFFRVVDRHSPCVMLYRDSERWVPISSQELYRRTVGVARKLLQWRIEKGDRISILSENRPEWAIADFAAMLVGAVVVPIYATLTPAQIAQLLRDSGTRVLFVSDNDQLQKVLRMRSEVPVEHIIVMDSLEAPEATAMGKLMDSGLHARDVAMDSLANTIAPEDLATLLYTSGTTGIQKGVVLSHGNLACNFSCSLAEFDLTAGSSSVSFLPLSHITARHVDYAMLHANVAIAYCPLLERLPQALAEVQPAIFVAVPRVYEKIRMQVEQTARSFAKRHILDWALSVGREHRQQILAGEIPSSWSWRMADRIVFSQVRRGMGGKVSTYLSGGAPLGRELAEWFADASIRIFEGYGLTETSPVIAVNTPKAHRLGTVGRPLANVTVRLAEDGEILVRGPSIFGGYWQMPEESAEAFDQGFFKTGDVGNMDADGFLSVIDRKKDLIKTSGGKMIAPQPIEASLKDNPLIAEAVVIGDRRKFPAVLVLPYFPLLEDWASVNGIAFDSRANLVREPRVHLLYEGIVESVNQRLARFEKLKKTVVLSKEFSTVAGTLTPTMKMRRRAIEIEHMAEIDALYYESEEYTSDKSVQG